ncbi:type II/IV secretion system ATPase subunit [Candidatus Woesearchaeota archaeon]|nr:type II/IV secretion system ATPase subunit [Candidatus Woesearchaeota archaeon]
MAEQYEIVKEGEEITLHVDGSKLPFFPSVEDDKRAMAMIIEMLAEAGAITKIVISQQRDYEYDYVQTEMLAGLAQAWRTLKQRKFFQLSPELVKYLESKLIRLKNTIHETMKGDPIAAYVELLRFYRDEKAISETGLPANVKPYHEQLMGFIKDAIQTIEALKIIRANKDVIAGYKEGDREPYRRIFSPVIRPDFMYTKLMSLYPPDAEEIANYALNETEVALFKLPESVQYLYHIMPPEFRLDEEKYAILDAARKIMSEHKPTKNEFVDPERIRHVFTNIGMDLLEELAGYKGLTLSTKEKQELAEILVRYTIGFGLIEVLLQDEAIQDISINSPMGRTPMFIVHGEFGDCMTNIIPTHPEAESWASKLRLISGRPLDEANPILDTELQLPSARARISVITNPLNPTGIAFSFRRHRDKPWTLPLFVKTGMITPLAAGLISFIIDGARTILVAGTRSSGKTSLLGSFLTELMRRTRIITIEDTLELPVDSLRKIGYNIQSMKVASALTKGTTEVSADEGIRTTLRLGDSALFVGEVRSTEAKALYESMRVGALANVVCGTIHGDSPYGVFDRVVNDLEVPRTSFKATDIIIVANPIRSPDGIHRVRRVTQITEVRKTWDEDPLRENGFVDLMKYDAVKDQLVPTNDLLAGNSEILKSIAGNVKEWAGNWEAVWENIQLRADIKQAIVEAALVTKDMNLLEAEFSIQCNDVFHTICESVREELGYLKPDRILFEWKEWLKQAIKKRQYGY